MEREVRENLKSKSYEVITPIEYNASKTIIVKRLDPIIDEYTTEEIMNNIETQNDWLKVEELYKFETTAKILKIRCQSSNAVKRELEEGLYITNQRVKPNQVEKELFIKLTPCNNCFEYTHTTNKCPYERLTLCTFCSSNEHRVAQCLAMEAKCLNCGAQHRTLAAACPVRKKLIKERRTEIRARSRSRSRTNEATLRNIQGGSYRDATQQGVGLTTTGMNKQELKTTVTKIISAVVFSHYMEALHPGTFQGNMDAIFEKNGLPKVLFPTDIVTEDVLDVFRDITREEEERQAEAEEMEAELQTFKRMRESTSPQGDQYASQQRQSTIKKKREEKTTGRDSTSQDTQQEDDSQKQKAVPQPRKVHPAPAPAMEESSTEQSSQQEKGAKACPRSDSQSSVSSRGGTISTRELDITIYAPPTETNKKIFQQKNLTDSNKEMLMRNLLQGKC